MKRGLSLFLSMIMILGVLASCPVMVNAADVSDLSFKFDTQTSGYAVTDCPTTASGEIIIPDTYNNQPVTIVGTGSFSNCKSLKSVVIPDSVVRIDGEAFYNCSTLETVNFSNNLKRIETKAFYACSYIQELNLPESLEYIGSYAFAGVSVTQLTIPDSVKTIDDYAFYDCSLRNIDLGNSVEKIGDYAFAKNSILSSVVIPESLKIIEANAFQDCQSISKIYITDIAKWCNIMFYNHYANPLIYCYNYFSKYGKYCYLYLNGSPVTDLVIPENTEKISSNAFINYTHLKSVTLPDSLKSIGEDAFYGTDQMESVFISNMSSWLSIDFGNGLANPLAWSDTSKLYLNGNLVTSVKAPDDIKEIKSYAFYGYSTLEEFEFHSEIDNIGASVFNETAIYNNTENWDNGVLYLGNCLVAVGSGFSGDCEIKDGTKVIAKEAFKNIRVVESLKIPDSVTKIDNRTFFNCTGLASVDLGNGVTILEDQAFYDCTGLTTITLNENIEKIGKYAFYGCSLLSLALSLGGNVEYIGDYAFYNCVGLTSVSIKGNDCEMGSYTFNQCTGITNVVLDGVKTIGERAFSGCTEVENVQLINVETVGACAFVGCTSLKTVDSGNALKEISESGFAGNTALENINFPETLECIGYSAFNDCDGLTELVIGKNVKEIDDNAFYDCEGLTEIKVYSEELETSSMAFMGCINVKTLYLDTQAAVNEMPVSILENLNEVVIGETVTEIPQWRFGAGNLTTITIPKSVTVISDDAFYDCPKLATVYYGGSPSKWNAISIGINNESLLNAEIIYAEHDHEPTEKWIVDIESTCTMVGSQHKDCVICGIVLETEEIPLKAHIPGGDWILDYDATCTKAGLGHRNCEICGEIAQTEFIPETGHTAGGWIIDSPATVYKAGSKHKECSECGEILETAKIAQLKASKPTLKSIENTEYGVLTKWSAVKGADTYRVYRKTSKTDWEYIGSTSKTYYTDKTAKSGTKYYYAVKSRNEAGNSSLSSSLSIRCLADPTLKTPSSTTKGVGLKWTKVTGAQGYMVYRKTSSGSYKRIATEKGVSNTSFRDTSAKKGVKYTYKVKAYYSKTYSAYSNTKTITDKY